MSRSRRVGVYDKGCDRQLRRHTAGGRIIILIIISISITVDLPWPGPWCSRLSLWGSVRPCTSMVVQTRLTPPCMYLRKHVAHDACARRHTALCPVHAASPSECSDARPPPLPSPPPHVAGCLARASHSPPSELANVAPANQGEHRERPSTIVPVRGASRLWRRANAWD